MTKLEAIIIWGTRMGDGNDLYDVVDKNLRF